MLSTSIPAWLYKLRGLVQIEVCQPLLAQAVTTAVAAIQVTQSSQAVVAHQSLPCLDPTVLSPVHQSLRILQEFPPVPRRKTQKGSQICHCMLNEWW